MDVELESQDGRKIPANRTILALRSGYFEALFYGKLSSFVATKEQPQQIVKLPQFNERTLKEVVYFSFCDGLSLREPRERACCKGEDAKFLVHVLAASKYLLMEELWRMTFQRCIKYLKLNRLLVRAMLKEAVELLPGHCHELEQVCVHAHNMSTNELECMEPLIEAAKQTMPTLISSGAAIDYGDNGIICVFEFGDSSESLQVAGDYIAERDAPDKPVRFVRHPDRDYKITRSTIDPFDGLRDLCLEPSSTDVANGRKFEYVLPRNLRNHFPNDWPNGPFCVLINQRHWGDIESVNDKKLGYW